MRLWKPLFSIDTKVIKDIKVLNIKSTTASVIFCARSEFASNLGAYLPWFALLVYTRSVTMRPWVESTQQSGTILLWIFFMFLSSVLRSGCTRAPATLWTPVLTVVALAAATQSIPSWSRSEWLRSLPLLHALLFFKVISAMCSLLPCLLD